MKIKLNTRQQQILLYYLESGGYAQLNPLADQLGVSLRTLQRELSELDPYLARFGIRFDKKLGLGMKLQGDAASLKALSDQLAHDRSMQQLYSAEERQSIIKQMLLSSKEPRKLYVFGKELNVSESTVASDLQKTETWFEKYGIRLQRKPGIGVYIDGTEKSIRAALADLLYENVTQEQLMEFLYEHANRGRDKLRASIRHRLLNFIDPQWLFKIEQVIQEMEQNRGFKMADNAYVGFVVHLALASQRLKNREEITIEGDILERLKRTKEFGAARELAAVLSAKLGLDIPESEVGYITMHILGARSNHVMGEDFDYTLIQQYASRMISIMEQELKLELSSDDMLAANLTTHLSSAVKRIELGMAVRNPLLQQVKDDYPDIFEATRRASRYLEQQLGKPIPEEEIGYLAMHFGTAMLNKKESGEERYRVLLVCSSGIGTSRLLQAQIKIKLPRLQVVDTVSLFHLEDWLREHPPVDLVVSTLPVHLDSVDAAVVSPFLTDEEAAGLNEKLSQLKKADRAPKEDRLTIEQTVDKVGQYGKALAGLLRNIEVAIGFRADGKMDLIERIMAFVADKFDVRDVGLLQADLLKREELGPLLLEEERIAMLHCRSEGIGEMAVSLFRLEEEVHWQTGNRRPPVRTVLTLLGPTGAPKENFELVSEISMALVEESTTRILTEGSGREIEEHLQLILKKGYIRLAGQSLRT